MIETKEINIDIILLTNPQILFKFPIFSLMPFIIPDPIRDATFYCHGTLVGFNL